jgi:AraC-like DNA-binding protein
MTQEKRVSSIFGVVYQSYFESDTTNPVGDLLAAGIGIPHYRNNLQDTQKLWSSPYFGLIFVTGTGKAFYRNETGFECELSHGDFFISFPGIKRLYVPGMDEEWGELYISFTGEMFSASQKHGIISPSQPVWRLGQPEKWMKKLQQFAQRPVPLLSRDRLRRAVDFWGYLLRMMSESSPVTASSTNVDWFHHACSLLTKDLHNPVDLRLVARELKMSYNTFRNYFQKRAGVSPMRYRDQVRINAACKHLTGDLSKSVEVIAFYVGYSSPQRFSEQFKKHTGMSPTAYRKRHSNKDR